MKLFFCFVFTCGATVGLWGQVKISNTYVEGMTAPSGIDRLHPRLSWRISSDRRNVIQESYQVIVASSLRLLAQNVGDVWNSGNVSSPQSHNIEFPQPTLKSCREYFWKVKVRTNAGVSAWSKPSKWSMAILDSSIWNARWIGSSLIQATDSPYAGLTRLSARYLRKEFSTKGKPKRAVVYLCGLGLYELYVNGKKVGKNVLAPALTQYNKSVPYHSIDITHYLSAGDNAVGVMLGNGRYFPVRYSADGGAVAGAPASTSFGLPELLFQLQVENPDGTQSSIVSDTTWKVTTNGPIRANNEFDGEEYDARMELSQWTLPAYNDASWSHADIMPAPQGRLVSHFHEGIQVNDSITPVSIIKTKRKSFILDMGQNMVGWLKIRVRGQAGDTVSMKFSETLAGEDSLYLANIRGAKAADLYILKGSREETWEPKFTYHGFRFVEIRGLRNVPKLSDFKGQVVYDKLNRIGQFESSNEVINRVFHNALWSIIGNYRSIPTDCPQRDERMGWLGDRAINAYGESFLFDNARFYAKWMDDIQNTQTEEGSLPDVAPSYWKVYSDDVSWPITYLIIPRILWRQFGDTITFTKHYPYMKKWVMYMWEKYGRDSLVMRDTYGDWCLPPESIDSIFSKDSTRNTWGQVIGAAYFYHAVKLMGEYAAAQHISDDSLFFHQLGDGMKEAFNRKFYHVDSAYYANNTVTSNLLPLAFGIVPEKDRQKVFDKIVERTNGMYKGHVSTGLIGGQWLMRTLSEYGSPDLACSIAMNKTYPSWGYMAEQGATTMWELWNGNTASPSMNSGNHVMLIGDLLVWLYENLAGIKSDNEATGFKKINMKPYFDKRLTSVKASTYSPYGQIVSNWRSINGSFSWIVHVPENSTAELSFPVTSVSQLKESDLPIDKSGGIISHQSKKDGLLVIVGSGHYRFEWKSAQ